MELLTLVASERVRRRVRWRQSDASQTTVDSFWSPDRMGQVHCHRLISIVGTVDV
jgi:hypothetical protein